MCNNENVVKFENENFKLLIVDDSDFCTHYINDNKEYEKKYRNFMIDLLKKDFHEDFVKAGIRSRDLYGINKTYKIIFKKPVTILYKKKDLTFINISWTIQELSPYIAYKTDDDENYEIVEKLDIKIIKTLNYIRKEVNIKDKNL